MGETRGEWIQCGSCRGYGLRDTFGGLPDECRHCNAGSLWRYPSGVLALYPGGPLAGREMPVAAPPSRGTAETETNADA